MSGAWVQVHSSQLKLEGWQLGPGKAWGGDQQQHPTTPGLTAAALREDRGLPIKGVLPASDTGPTVGGHLTFNHGGVTLLGLSSGLLHSSQGTLELLIDGTQASESLPTNTGVESGLHSNEPDPDGLSSPY